MVQGVFGSHSTRSHDAAGHGVNATMLPWQTHVENAVEYSGPGGNNAPQKPQTWWQKTKSHSLELALGVLLGGGAGALFHTKFPTFVKGGLTNAILAGAASGAGLMAIGLKDWVVNTAKLPYSIWYGLHHKHEINPGQKRNPFLPEGATDMLNEDIFHYAGKNPMIPDKGFLSADIFDRTYVNGTYGGF